VPCAAGYAAGLFTTYAALWFSWFGDQGQPALLYLVPATLGTVLALGAWRGELALLFATNLSSAPSADPAHSIASKQYR
jgi:signal peptide peptidase-like protein 2B